MKKNEKERDKEREKVEKKVEKEVKIFLKKTFLFYSFLSSFFRKKN